MARQPKGTCPRCGKKGLGVTFPAGGGRHYRQCTYCNTRVDVPPRRQLDGDLDRRDDNTGLDDGPPLPGSTPRKRTDQAPGALSEIRRQAWQTRRARYGDHGHR